MGLVRKRSNQICINVCMSVGAGRKYSNLIVKWKVYERACISLI